MNTVSTYPKITVVTPNYNQGEFLERTISSVIEQEYPNLEYIIVDGGSTDTSVDIIKKYQQQLHYWVSEPDKGMYDAINKGFLQSSGAIMCWINSDDVLWEGSLYYIAKKFTENKKVQWLQGLPSVINEKGALILQREPVFSSWFFYLKEHRKHFSFIQQESTFWSRQLWDKAGGELSLQYSLASDFDLWMRFFNFETMYCSKRQLAAFRKREGQKSSNQTAYLEEVERSLKGNFKEISVLKKINFYVTRAATKILSKLPWGVLKRLKNKWIEHLIGSPKWID
ncbi:glycosyltransferase family 2 protein [Aequorivita sp. CIP111184]|uniref:glycosyltransferase family 2 protein n=1 Tax=Aequorivita sp. CIP111184 TaxID=2211356 RepID=UPI000DBC372F|nr:glycosyltransferase family 2 protein [Aequorivita sp. CIP111184]SRX55352.1 putative glycosyltransferase [Aequorivita sp. CIP111184]